MTLRVRMYRQGLGDCFLLSCTDGGETSHLLIDCGVLKGTPDATQRMEAVAKNVSETTDKRLDRLVVTHEHWDHLSGFLQAQPVFEPLEVGEVWLAWTEDPHDELAAELRRRKEKRTLRRRGAPHASSRRCSASKASSRRAAGRRRPRRSSG
jgi:glyoxylase-like metal-dependent hydrolase (beta-lactamase superfamily II)